MKQRKIQDLGACQAKSFVDEFIKKIFLKEQIEIKEINKKCIENSFKDPIELVNFAYKSSFEIGDFKNIFKYVTDNNRYCLEICLQNVKPQIEINIKKKLNFLSIFAKLFQSLIDLNVETDGKSKTVYQFVDLLKNKIKLDGTKYANVFSILDQVKSKMINVDIKDINLFNEGFKNYVINKKKDLNKDLETVQEDFVKKAKKEVKEYVEIYLGCESVCPGCGSKCQNSKGHDGSHASTKHLFDGFNGWGEKDTNNTTTYFCWEEKKFLKLKVYTGPQNSVEYSSFKDYVNQKHQNWLYDIEDNYNKLGKNESSASVLKFKRETMKAWMNTRKPILEKYNRKDLSYSVDWTSLQDNDKMLKLNHVAEWDDSI